MPSNSNCQATNKEQRECNSGEAVLNAVQIRINKSRHLSPAQPIRSATPLSPCKTPARSARPFLSFPFLSFDLLHPFLLNIYHNILTMLSSPVSLALWLSLLSGVLAAPKPALTAGQSIPIHRRTPSRTAEEWGNWAKNHRDMLMSKYGDGPNHKRSSGTNL